MVERLFLAVPQGCLQFVIVVFPDHTYLLFLMRRATSLNSLLCSQYSKIEYQFMHSHVNISHTTIMFQRDILRGTRHNQHLMRRATSLNSLLCSQYSKIEYQFMHAHVNISHTTIMFQRDIWRDTSHDQH